MAKRKTKVTREVQLFSQSFERAGGASMFPNLQPTGLVSMGFDHFEEHIKDYVSGREVKIPRTLPENNYAAERYLLAKMGCTHLFNIKIDDNGEVTGDAYKPKALKPRGR